LITGGLKFDSLLAGQTTDEDGVFTRKRIHYRWCLSITNIEPLPATDRTALD